MSVLIGRYEFEGPLINWRGVKNQAGIYAIMSYSKQEFQLVEVAEADDLQAVLLEEDKQTYWQSKSLGMLTFSVHYSRACRGKRLEIVGEIFVNLTGDARRHSKTAQKLRWALAAARLFIFLKQLYSREMDCYRHRCIKWLPGLIRF